MTQEMELSLVEKAKLGDHDAFEELMLENQTRVYNLALKMVSDPDDAFDMSQEAFIKAYNSLENFRGESKLSVWLYRLTTNVCLDFLRSKKRKAHSSLTVISDDEEETEIEIKDERFSPQNELEKKELSEALNRGIAQLPEDYRAAFILREVNNLSYDEIAVSLNVEQGTVKSRIFRARKKLLKILSEDGNFSSFVSSNKAKGGGKHEQL